MPMGMGNFAQANPYMMPPSMSPMMMAMMMQGGDSNFNNPFMMEIGMNPMSNEIGNNPNIGNPSQ